MDEQYTPTTAEIREYVEVGGEPRPWEEYNEELDAKRAAAFDRWLTAHDREVAEKAWREGNTATIAYYASRVGDDGLIDQHAAIGAGRIGNPYRQSIEGEQR